jgi:triosephosphate isomerase
MHQIFVNLKRFDVPKRLSGLCPVDHPLDWIQSIIADSAELGLGSYPDLRLVFLLPEGLVPAAVACKEMLPADKAKMIEIGCQGVHWEDVQPGKNFGAFTSSHPARAEANLGSQWAIIGHSEERKAKLQVIQTYDPAVDIDPLSQTRAAKAVNCLIQSEVTYALQAGLQVLLCIGETAQERGEGSFEEQKPRIEQVLKSQLLAGLEQAREALLEGRVVIGYEPIWAIGPGKTPPGKEYISFVSSYIQRIVKDALGAKIGVVYGGGLKEENAGMIASIETIDGGLVALTRFTGEIGFDVPGLKGIIEKYLASEKS